MLEASPLGVAMRGSASLYPAVNLAHLAGLVLLLGAIGVLDLRIAGLGRAVPLPALSRFLTPLGATGLVLLLGSGLMMFAADATPLIESPPFRLKMAALLLAILNAIAFRRWFGDLTREPSPLARLMAIASLVLWTSVAALGRLIGYA